MSVPFMSSDGVGGNITSETTAHRTDVTDTTDNPRIAIANDTSSQALRTGLEFRDTEPSQIDTSALTEPSDPAEAPDFRYTSEGYRDGDTQPGSDDEEYQTDDEKEVKLRRKLAKEIRTNQSRGPAKLKLQRESGRKRGLQASHFLIAIENRMRELEAEVKRLQKAQGRKFEEADVEIEIDPGAQVPSKEISAGFLLQPAKLAWSEFSRPSHLRASKDQSAIDVLIEKPHSFGQKPSPFGPFDVEPHIPSGVPSHKRRRQSGLGQADCPVERIRLNSSHLEQAFEDILGGDIQLHGPDPAQHLRPFKAIVPYTNELIAKLSELEQLLEKRDEMETTSTNGSKILKATSSDSADTEVEPDGADSKGDTDNSEHFQLYIPRPDLAAMRDHVKALVGCFETTLSAEISSYTWLRSRIVVDQSPKVSFADLWYLFAPGDLIYDHFSGQALRVLSVRGGSTYLVDEIALPPPQRFDTVPYPVTGRFAGIRERLKATDTLADFVLTCFYLSFDGVHFGPVQKDIIIEPFGGNASIDSLAAMPMEYAKDTTLRSPQSRSGQATGAQQSLQAALLARGRLFADLARPGEAGM
jgi:hypothetical protein